MIKLEHVSKHFGDVIAVNDVSFEIQKGEVVGFLGPNGAGKSTTMKMITGFLPPSEGLIQIAGRDIQEDPVFTKNKIGYLPENTPLYYDMIALDYLEFMGQVRGLKGQLLKSNLKRVVEQCQLGDVLNKKITSLSKGFKQRVGLAQALIHNPDILILDEPSVGLDPNQIAGIRDLIKEIGKSKTVLLSTHILSEVSATCQKAMIINQGKIVAQGTTASLTEHQEEQCEYEVDIRGPAEAIKEKLKKLPGYLSSNIYSSEQNNLQRMTVKCKGDEDYSEDIFQLVADNQWKLAKLSRHKLSLEDVFKKLTR